MSNVDDSDACIIKTNGISYVARDGLGRYILNDSYSPADTPDEEITAMVSGLSNFIVFSNGKRINLPANFIETNEKIMKLQGTAGIEEIKQLEKDLQEAEQKFIYEILDDVFECHSVIAIQAYPFSNLNSTEDLLEEYIKKMWMKLVFLGTDEIQDHESTLLISITNTDLYNRCSVTGKLAMVRSYTKEALRTSSCPVCSGFHSLDLNVAKNLKNKAELEFPALLNLHGDLKGYYTTI